MASFSAIIFPASSVPLAHVLKSLFEIGLQAPLHVTAESLFLISNTVNDKNG